jgi:hypothetical protein
VQGILDDAGAFGRTGLLVGRVLFGEARRFGSGARSGWETARDQARSARSERRGDEPWPIVRAARSGAVRAQEWAERRAGSGSDVPNEPEPNDPNGDPNDIWRDPPVTSTAPEPGMGDDRADPNGPPDLAGPVSPVLAWQEIPFETVDGREEDVDGAPIGPARQSARVEFYRAYVERGALKVRASLRRLDADTSYAAVKDHGERSTQRGWTTVHETGWLPSMPDVVARVRAAVLSDLGSPPGPYRMEWFTNGALRGRDGWSDAALREAGIADGDPRTDPDTQPDDPNVDPNEGCLHVAAWVITPTTTAGPGYREPRYCGAEREPGWVLCSEHLEARRADPDYPQDDIDEFRADPDHLGPDGYRPSPTPNGDPNVPLPSTVPDANGDVKCGCCAQLHKPLPPGQHCPACHIHTLEHLTAPMQHVTTINPKGPSMDINSAPAAIAAVEAFGDRFEGLQSRADTLAAEWDTLKADADTLHGEFATVMDGMGDFAIGGEADTAAAFGEMSESATSAKEQADNVVGSITAAKEAHASYLDNLEDDLRPGIEAAAGKVADVHSVMQEA